MKAFVAGVLVGSIPWIAYVGYVVVDTVKRFRDGTLFR
jgi:hypothetical protein